MSRIVYIGTPEVDAATVARRLRADIPGMDLYASNDRAAAVAHAADAEVLIAHHFQFDDELLARAPRLRWIQSLTSGTDAILGLRSLHPDILVTSTRGMHGDQMSELVFLQMLALGRDFPRMLANQRAHRWERWPQPLLAGKTVVIVGVGAVAMTLAPRCRAFGMRVYGVSTTPRAVTGFDAIYGRERLAEVAALADFLVLIVPHTPATEKLVDARVLAAMRPGAFLINVARGGVLDEQALLAALRERRIAGAALDVFRRTPLPPEDPLWAAERVILTSHVGGVSDVYLEQCYPIVRANLEHFLAGRRADMLNVVAH